MIGKKMLLSWVGAGLLSAAAIPAVATTTRHHTASPAKAIPAKHTVATVSHRHAIAVGTRHHAVAHRTTTSHATKAVHHVQSTHHAVSHKKTVAASATRKPAVSTVKHTAAAPLGVRSMHSGHATLASTPARKTTAKVTPVVAIKHTTTTKTAAKATPKAATPKTQTTRTHTLAAATR
jgi:hypothetical protein